jgi:hypothetical protein
LAGFGNFLTIVFLIELELHQDNLDTLPPRRPQYDINRTGRETLPFPALSEFNAKNSTGKDSWEEEIFAYEISKVEFHARCQTVVPQKTPP